MSTHPSIPTQTRQPAALWYAISVYMWEYFSFYGMRALLVLYLANELLFTDKHAYALYGAYTSLVYVTPIIGGIIADRYLGYYWSSLVGAATMVCGHIVLGLTGYGLYVGLALIICGYGLFKTNVNCLLGTSYGKQDHRRDSGFALMYVGGNVGAFLAPILCAWAADEFGWHYGFLIAAIGMAIGLVIFISGRKHFTEGNKPQWVALKKKGLISFKVLPTVVLGIFIATIFFTFVLYYLFAGIILSACVIITALFLIKLFIKVDKKDKIALFSICVFMVFGLIFWVFDQQGGSSVSLFIERNINRQFFNWVIPAASFQSINPFAILIGGFMVSILWKVLTRLGINPRALVKITIGILLISIGFFLIAQGAKIASMTDGHASMGWIVAGLLIMGVAELFVDPVALAEITRLNPAGQVGFLAGVYMLFTGAIANYVAAEVAELTSVTTVKSSADFLINSATQYYKVFSEIFEVSFTSCAVLIAICVLTAIYNKLSKSH